MKIEELKYCYCYHVIAGELNVRDLCCNPSVFLRGDHPSCRSPRGVRGVPRDHDDPYDPYVHRHNDPCRGGPSFRNGHHGTRTCDALPSCGRRRACRDGNGSRRVCCDVLPYGSHRRTCVLYGIRPCGICCGIHVSCGPSYVHPSHRISLPYAPSLPYGVRHNVRPHRDVSSYGHRDRCRNHCDAPYRVYHGRPYRGDGDSCTPCHPCGHDWSGGQSGACGHLPSRGGVHGVKPQSLDPTRRCHPF